jgi:hypothetical protein
MGNHEYFYSTGQLFRVDRADGTVVSLAYPYPWMTIVSDQNGRKIEYHLNSSTGNITQIQVGPDPAANYSMSYDAEGRLTQITDGYNHRKFKYRPASGASPADGSRHLLEEVADKLDAQRSRYIYDPQSAKVIETYHFDGTGQINRYQYQYNFSSLLSPSVTVTPPLNGPRNNGDTQDLRRAWQEPARRPLNLGRFGQIADRSQHAQAPTAPVLAWRVAQFALAPSFLA